MAHQDQGQNGSACSHAYDLHKTPRWLMGGVSMSGIVFRSECTWTPKTLGFAALLWAWSDEKTLLERFTTAGKIIINRHAGQSEPAGSYRAFIKMLRKWTEPLRKTISTAFRQRMAETLAAVWMIEGWSVFALDGTRVDVPRTRIRVWLARAYRRSESASPAYGGPIVGRCENTRAFPILASA